MRRIDADALKDKLKKNHDFLVGAWGSFSAMPLHDKTRADAITHCIAEVVNAPTIEAEPVKHGRWIETEQENGCAVWTDYKCPVCGAVFNGNDRLFDEWKGCPVCLTKMDLEE